MNLVDSCGGLEYFLHHEMHLYWPAFDVDLELEFLEDPERFPLIAP